MTIHLVRHADARPREPRGDDSARPLSSRGEGQARALVDRFSGIPVTRVLSSPAVRCRDTVAPLARARDLAVEGSDALAEAGDPQALLAMLAAADPGLVACSHGDMIPAVVELALRGGARCDGPQGWSKASTWELEVAGGAVIALRWWPPPF